MKNVFGSCAVAFSVTGVVEHQDIAPEVGTHFVRPIYQSGNIVGVTMTVQNGAYGRASRINLLIGKIAAVNGLLSGILKTDFPKGSPVRSCAYLLG